MRASVLILVAATSALCQEAASVGAAAANAHAFGLFHLLRQATADNFCFSPFSSHQVAAMLADGAAGTTQAEMLKLAFLPADNTQREAYLQAMRAELQSASNQGGLQLGVANSLWAPETLPFTPAFKQLAEENYGATCGVIPADNPAQAAVAINDWVRQRTNGKITNLVGPSNFPAARPAAVLVNAVYLKSSWAEFFDPEQTKPRPFAMSDGSSTMLSTMTKLETSSYAEGNGWQCLRLPFKSAEIGFHILLPNDNSQRKKIEAEFSDDTWEAVQKAMTLHEVTSFIPRFNYSTQLSLKNMWQALGAKDVFIDGKADLSKMIEKEACYITDVIHQATIEVNELGAEAAAATVAIPAPFASAMPPPLKRVTFRADKPFLWLITHRSTGLILFMGRFAGR